MRTEYLKILFVALLASVAVVVTMKAYSTEPILIKIDQEKLMTI